MKLTAGGPRPDEIWYLSVEGFFTRGTFYKFLSKFDSVYRNLSEFGSGDNPADRLQIW